MPATLLPPGIDRQPDRHHDGGDTGDIGNGRKPPTDKRTGGNGDGDSWDGKPRPNRGPRHRLSQARIGVLFALGGDLIFFVALVSVFFVDKNSGHVDGNRWVNGWLPTAIPSILWLNTAVLLLSSLTAEAARRGMFREVDVMDEWFGFGRPTSKRATLWLTATLALGLLFLAGQWTAWNQLHAMHVLMTSNPSSKFFYIITWTHAVHLVLGIGALVTVLAVLQKSKQIATRQVWVDSTVWYWHMMGVLWLFLFVLLQYGQG